MMSGTNDDAETALSEVEQPKVEPPNETGTHTDQGAPTDQVPYRECVLVLKTHPRSRR